MTDNKKRYLYLGSDGWLESAIANVEMDKRIQQWQALYFRPWRSGWHSDNVGDEQQPKPLNVPPA